MWRNNRNRLVERISTPGNFQVMTGHVPEQHSLTSDLVLLWAGGWLRSVILITTWVKHLFLTLSASYKSFILTFSTLKMLFIILRHLGSVWMSALYSILAQKAFKIGSTQLQVLFQQINCSCCITVKKSQKRKCNAMSCRNLIQPPNKKRSQNSGVFLSSSCAKYDSGSECFHH